MNIITEEQLEQLCIDWFVELGYEYKDGHDIAPESNKPERDDFRKVILEDRLKSSLTRIKSKYNKCPFCSNFKASVTNSISSIYPEIARQWHPTKNGSLTHKDVTTGTNKIAWWKCPKGPDHEWKAQVYERTSGKTGCPFCSGQKVSVTNSLKTLSPEIARQWHPTKNGSLTPKDVIAGGHKMIWFKCENTS